MGVILPDKEKRKEEIREIIREEMKTMPGGKRPTGVTIIAVLGILGSLLMLVGGITMIGFSGMMGTIMEETAPGTVGFGSMFILLGIVTLIFGIVGLVGSVFLLKMKKIGWILITVVGILSIIMSILSFQMTNLVSIVLWIIIIGYLYTKRQLFV